MERVSNINIRAIEPEDLDWLYGIENDAELWDIGQTNVPYSRYSLHRYLSETSSDIYADKQLRLIIETKKEKKAVGIIDLMNFEPRHQRAEIGVVIAKPYRHNGYAREALRQTIEYSRSIIHLNQIYAFVGEQNQASRQLFVSMNFQQTTFLKQWLRTEEGYEDVVVYQLFL